MLGARIGLWDGLLVDWLAQLRLAMPDVSLRAEVGFEPDLMHGPIDGWLVCSEDRSRGLIDPVIEQLDALVRESG